MIHYSDLWQALAGTALGDWQAKLDPLIAGTLAAESHGDLPHWYEVLARLPAITPDAVDLNADCLRIGMAEQLDEAQREQLRQLLMAFHPWRKGPFCLFGLHIDTEWRSDWKWQRIAPHIDLRGKRILDVGCGNGYYGWRMLGAGAELVLGVDPTMRYVMQYAALRHFIGASANYVLPLKFEDLPEHSTAFDVVFSMGVLYHRKDPLEHLRRLHGQLRPGGELVLEGLVLEDGSDAVLHPRGRYAKMKNVYAIPSVALMVQWLEQAGFGAVRVLDVAATTRDEQRRTSWMHFESLEDFLDPQDSGRTVEGHPAPIRACLACRKED